MEYRMEHDTMGEIAVEADKLWGAQTQRSFENFRIGSEKMPLPVIYALAAVKDASMLWLIPVAAIVTAVVPYLAYTKGLQTTEASRAAILATVEPVVATVLGALVYREKLSLPAFLGILSVLAAIVLLNAKGKKE